MTLIEAHLRDVKNMFARRAARAQRRAQRRGPARSRQRVLLIETHNMRDVADADLRRVTGIPAEAIALSTPRSTRARPARPTVPALLAEAMTGRPERQALQARVRRPRGTRGAAVAAGLKPVICVRRRLRLRQAEPEDLPADHRVEDSWDVGVNVAWPLWDGGRVKADVARRPPTSARSTSGSPSSTRPRLRGAPAAARSRRRRARRLSASADEVAAAAEARRVVAERFKAGLVSNTEVLDAQQALLVAELERTRPRPPRGSRRHASTARLGAEASHMTHAVTVRDLTRRFGAFLAVDHVSFDVEAGRDLRLPRQQRRREVDDDPDAVRTAQALVRDGAGRRNRRRPGSRRRQAAHRLHVAAFLALRAADRRGEHHVLRRPLRPRRSDARRAPGLRARRWPGWKAAGAPSRAISPAGGGSASPWAAPSSTSRASSSSTSRRAASTRSRAASSGS